ncbi:MAG TPA: hypothetical protein VMZ33_07300 [Candidatus Limnocylindrales bacterium]|nr:hypothetical protein [Candidatus Limnocylindrales bacterium]
MDDQRLHDELARRAESVRVEPDWSRRHLLSSVRHAIDTRPSRVSTTSRWSASAGLASVAAILLVLVFVAPRLAQGPAASDVPTSSETSRQEPSPLPGPRLAMSPKEFASVLTAGDLAGRTVLVEGRIDWDQQDGISLYGVACVDGDGIQTVNPSFSCLLGHLGDVEAPVWVDAPYVQTGTSEWRAPQPPAVGLLVLEVSDSSVHYLGTANTTGPSWPHKVQELAAIPASAVAFSTVHIVEGWLIETEPNGQNITIDCDGPAFPAIPGLPTRHCQPVDFLADEPAQPDDRGSLGTSDRLTVQRDAAVGFAPDEPTEKAVYAVAPRLYGGGCVGEPPCWLWEVIARVSEPPALAPTTPTPAPATPTPAPLGIIECTAEISVTVTDYIGEVVSCDFERMAPESIAGPTQVANPDGELRRLDISWHGSACATKVDVDFQATTDIDAGDRYRLSITQFDQPACLGPRTQSRLHLQLTKDVAADLVQAEVSTVPDSPATPTPAPLGVMDCAGGLPDVTLIDYIGEVVSCEASGTGLMFETTAQNVTNPDDDLTVLEIVWPGNPCADSIDLQFAATLEEYRLVITELETSNTICDYAYPDRRTVRLQLTKPVPAENIRVDVQEDWDPPPPPSSGLFVCGPMTASPGELRRWHPGISDPSGLIASCDASAVVGTDSKPIAISNPDGDLRTLEVTWTDACASYETLALLWRGHGAAYDLIAHNSMPANVICDGLVLDHVVRLHMSLDVSAADVVASVSRADPVALPTPEIAPTRFECHGPPAPPGTTPVPGPVPVVVDTTGLVSACLQTDSVEPLTGPIGVSNPFEDHAIEVVWATGVCDNAIEFTFATGTEHAYELVGARPPDCKASVSPLPVYITFSQPMLAADIHAVLENASNVRRTSVGDFRLSIFANRREFEAEDLIDISASLLYQGGSESITVAGVGTLVNGFSVRQLDGELSMGPAWNEPCIPETLTREVPYEVDFEKSGGYGPDDPNRDFYMRYLADPELRLPSGVWLITAHSEFWAGACSGDYVSLTASVVVRVR